MSIELSKVTRPSQKLVSRRRQRFVNLEAGPNPNSSVTSIDGNVSDLQADSDDEPEVQEHFDFTPVQDVIVKNMLFGPADLGSLTCALKACNTIRSLTFTRAGLTTRQLFALADSIPFTSLQTLAIEDNPLPDNDPDADPPTVQLAGPGRGDTANAVQGGDDSIDVKRVMSAGPGGSPAPPAASAAKGKPTAAAKPDDRRGSMATSASGPGRRSSVVSGAAGTSTAAPADAQSPTNHSQVTLPTRSRTRAWAQFMKRFSPLKRVSLRGNKIGPEEAEAICHSLSLNNTLQVLVLSHNRIGDAGLSSIAAGLRENSALASIAIADNGITFEAIPVLSQLLNGYQLNTIEHDARKAMETSLISELSAEIERLGYGACVASLAPNSAASVSEAVAGQLAFRALKPIPLPEEPVPAPAPAPAPKGGKPPASATAAPAVVQKQRLPDEAAFEASPNTSLHILDICNNPQISPEGLLALSKAVVPDGVYNEAQAAMAATAQGAVTEPAAARGSAPASPAAVQPAAAAAAAPHAAGHAHSKAAPASPAPTHTSAAHHSPGSVAATPAAAPQVPHGPSGIRGIAAVSCAGLGDRNTWTEEVAAMVDAVAERMAALHIELII